MPILRLSHFPAFALAALFALAGTRALAADTNACDLNELKGIAQRRVEAKTHAEDAKRGIAGMPYSEKKLQAAEKELVSHEAKAAETAFRNVPDEVGSELKRLEALTKPSTAAPERAPAAVAVSAFSDGAYAGEKQAGANLAVFADKFDPPSAGQREAMQRLLSQTNPKIDQVIVAVDRHAGALYADRVKMAELAFPKDPRVKFADLNKISGESHADLIDQIAKKNAAHTVTAVVPGDELLSKDFAFVKNPNARYAVVTGKNDSEMIMSVAAAKAGGRKDLVSSVATESGGLAAKSKAAALDPSVARYVKDHSLYGAATEGEKETGNLAGRIATPAGFPTIRDLSPDPGTREILAEQARLSIKRREQTLRDLLKAQPANKELRTFDTIVVGGGPQASTFVANSGGTRTLLINDARRSGTFSKFGDTFVVNSEEVLGSASTNIIHGASDKIQVRQVANSNFVTGKTIGDIGDINLALSKSDFLYGTKASHVEWEEGRKLWRVETSEGAFYAKNVNVGTGLGGKKFPFSDEGTKKLLAEDAASKHPRLQFIDDFMTEKQLLSEKGKNPLEQIAGKRYVVAGQGDGGAIVAKYLVGQAPEEGYGGHAASADNVAKKVYWFGQKASTQAEYEAASWGPYRTLGTEFGTGRMANVPARLDHIEKITEGPDAGAFKFFYGPKETDFVVADGMVAASGYDNDVGKNLFSGLKGGKVDFPIVRGEQSGDAIARGVTVDGKSQEGLHVFGAATGGLETEGMPGGPKSPRIETLGPRTQELAQQVRASVGTGAPCIGCDAKPSLTLKPLATAAPVEARSSFSAVKDTFRVRSETQREQRIQAHLFDALQDVALPKGKKADLTLVPNFEKSEIELRSRTLSQADLGKLREKLSKNDLGSLLLSQPGEKEKRGLEVALAGEAGGKISVSEASFVAAKTEQVIKIGPDEVGLIGYGSLINRESIERTLGRALPAEGLKEVDVKGWKRSWDVFMPNEAFYENTADGGRNYPPKIAYLNFKPDPNCTANCSLFIVNKKDLAGFDNREWIYERHDFTHALPGVKIEGGGAAYAYVGRKEFLYDVNKPGDVRMRSSYFDIVEKALEQKDPEYRARYWAGTDPAQPPRIADAKDLTKVQMDQPMKTFGPPVPHELAQPVVPSKISQGIPVYAHTDRGALKFQKPALAAAVDYQEAAARDLAGVRRRYWTGQATYQQLEAAQAKYGRLEVPVSGTSQASRRVGYLRQEQSYVARELAQAEVAGENSTTAGVAALRSQYAAVTAQVLGESEKRSKALATSPAAAKAARREALGSIEDTFKRNQAEFPGITYRQALSDPKQSDLLRALIARDAEADAVAAREARAALVSTVAEKLQSTQGPEKLAQDIVDLHASGAEPNALLKQGWSQDLVDRCVNEAICKARLEAPVSPVAEVSTRAKAALAEREIGSATGAAADEALRVAPEMPAKKAAELRETRAALETEAAAFAKQAEVDPAKFKPLEAETRAAAAAVAEKIDTLAAGESTLKAARPLTSAEEQLGDHALVAVTKYLGKATDEELGAVNPALRGLSTKGLVSSEERLEKYDRLANAALVPADRAKLFTHVSDDAKKGEGVVAKALAGAKPASEETLTKAFTKADALAKAIGETDGKVTRAVYREFGLNPAQQALADALGASKGSAESSLLRGAHAVADVKKVEAETKALAQTGGRSLASVETAASLQTRAGTELATLKGLTAAQRAEIVSGIGTIAGKDLATAKGALEKFKALSANPDMLETYRMSFAEAAKDFGKSKNWDSAWETGVKRMLEGSGYSKEEIMKVVDKESGLHYYQQTARCLKI